ncbi:MAG: glycosyltransferase [Candidatus Sericytochromatia bacterium]|nr:glycosyltransferase [Candidatus Sericytochromatia bacterium]
MSNVRSPWSGRRLLFIGQYPLSGMESAARLRIASLRDALSPLCDLTFITGTRAERRRPLWRLILSGGWRQFDGVYVESATSTAMEADLLLLWLWHMRQTPCSVYIRDGFPLFTDIFDSRPLKHKLLKAAWHLSMWAYQRFATFVYFPTRMLADHFSAPDRRVLSPGGTWRDDPGHVRRGVIYVGEVTPRYGVLDVLLPAAELLAAEDPDFSLCIVCPDPQRLADWLDRPWLRVKSAGGDEVSDLLHRAAVGVVPFNRHRYMDLALPVKLLHYLAHGLPVAVTDCSETARFVQQTDVGQVVAATPADFAAGLRQLLHDPERYRTCAANVVTAIQGPHSWGRRAETILADLCDGTAAMPADANLSPTGVLSAPAEAPQEV